ncbi:hypothetical protein Efla_007451 [Eimeria flavescens]
MAMASAPSGLSLQQAGSDGQAVATGAPPSSRPPEHRKSPSPPRSLACLQRGAAAAAGPPQFSCSLRGASSSEAVKLRRGPGHAASSSFSLPRRRITRAGAALRLPLAWRCVLGCFCCLAWLAGAAAEGPHHEGNPAAKSLKLRKKTLYAPQPLAGEILLSCPFGFDMVEGECVKAEIMKPQLVCPYGSFQSQQGACVVTDSVLPERVCPSGKSAPYEKGCIRKTVVQPTPLCPPTFHTSDETGSLLCVKPVGEVPKWACEAGTAEGPVCVVRHATPPTATCPDGFALEQGSCVRWSRTDVTFSCPPGFELSGDPQSPVCVMDREVAGVPSCRPPFIFQSGVCVHKEQYEPIPICSQGFHFDADTQLCRRVKLGRARAKCKDGWRYSQEENKCFLEEAPQLVCPPESNHFLAKGGAPALAEDGCAQVETEAPVYACQEGETAVFLGIDDRLGALPPAHAAAAAAKGTPQGGPPAPGGPGKGLGKHHKGKGPPVVEVGPPLPPPADQQGGGLPGGPRDKGGAPLAMGKGHSKHHKGKGAAAFEWAPPALPLIEVPFEEQQTLKMGAALEKGGPAGDTPKGPPIGSSPAGVWQRRAWGSPETNSSPVPGAEALLRRLQSKKAPAGSWEEGAHLGKGPPVSEGLPSKGPPPDGEAVGPPAPVKGWALLVGGEALPPPSKESTKAGGAPVLRGGRAPQMLCETLETSLDALKLECPPGSTATVSKGSGEQSCRETKREAAQAVCEVQGAELQADGFCLWRESVEALPVCVELDSNYDLASNTCLRMEYAEASPLCPVGLVFNEMTGMCSGLETLPPNYTCPEGFLLQHALPQDPKELLGDRDGPGGPGGGPGKPKKKGKKPATTLWEAAFCEQVELAAVQIVCPVGYALGKNKMGKAEACVADKQIQGTFTCEPGFFLVGADCIKHTRAEPTAVDTQGSAFPCVLRGSGVACGQKGPWVTEIREELLLLLEPLLLQRLQQLLQGKVVWAARRQEDGALRAAAATTERLLCCCQGDSSSKPRGAPSWGPRFVGCLSGGSDGQPERGGRTEPERGAPAAATAPGRYCSCCCCSRVGSVHAELRGQHGNGALRTQKRNSL